MRKNIRFFHFRGGIDYEKLGIIHKSMMGMLKTRISKKASKKLSDDDIEFLATHGGTVDFTDKNTILPLLELLKDQNH